jgi:hypothetical protein
MAVCCRQTALEAMKVNVDRISMCDYEQHHYDKELLQQAGLYLYSVTLSAQIMRMFACIICTHNAQIMRMFACIICTHNAQIMRMFAFIICTHNAQIMRMFACIICTHNSQIMRMFACIIFTVIIFLPGIGSFRGKWWRCG